MKKQLILFSLSLTLFLSIISTNFAEAAKLSTEQQITQTVQNFYTSLNKQNESLYLNSIVDSDLPENQFAAKNLESTKISYKIVKMEKISDTKYIVNIEVEKDGILYPVFPYEVVLADNNQWQLNTNSFSVTPKETSTKISLDNIFSENEKFIVQKITNANANTNIEQNEMLASSTLTYSFYENSTDIYLSGSATVRVYPLSYNDGIMVYAYKKTAEYPHGFDSWGIDTKYTNSHTFTGLYGYYYFRADSSNVPGYYTVSY